MKIVMPKFERKNVVTGETWIEDFTPTHLSSAFCYDADLTGGNAKVIGKLSLLLARWNLSAPKHWSYRLVMPVEHIEPDGRIRFSFE